MGFFSKIKEKLQISEKTSTNAAEVEAPKKTKILARYETMLNGVKAGNRQDILSSMEKTDDLRVSMIATRGTLGLSVSKHKTGNIGTIPSKIVNELESKYHGQYYPTISKYKITKDKAGVYQCFVYLQLNSER